MKTIIICKNEEDAIGEAILSALPLGEVVVVDSGSEDSTTEVALSAGASVHQFAWDGRYPKKKEWALNALADPDEWVLLLDADERVTKSLAAWITTDLPRALGDIVAFDIKLEYVFLGRSLRHGHKVWKRALLRPGAVEWPRPNDLEISSTWEVEGHYQPTPKRGRIERLTAAIRHEDPDGLADWLARHNRYSDWEAVLQSEDQKGRRLLGRVALKLPMRSVVFFLYSYVGRLGFLDGRQGLLYAQALSFYYWMIGAKRFESSQRPLPQKP